MGNFYIGVTIINIMIALLMLTAYCMIIVKSNRYPAKIIGISEPGTCYGTGGTSYSFQVEFEYEGKVIRKDTLSAVFIWPFFRKRILRGFKKRYQGRKVHVYYNPKNPQQILIQELLWKEFLMPVTLLTVGILILVL